MATESEFATAQAMLVRCGRAVSAYGPDVVVAGRMALVLYRLLPDAVDPGPAAGTREVDVVVPRRLDVKDRSIPQRLLEEHLVPYDSLGLDPRRRGKRRFQDEAFGVDRPAPTFVEFLAPRITDEDEMVEPQPELVASPLRYIDLLLFQPVSVVVDDVEVWVAAPSMFLAQKALMRGSVSGRREDKDLVSIWEVCLLMALRLPQERLVVDAARVKSETWSKWLERAAATLRRLFASRTSDGVVAVVAALRGQAHAPQADGVVRAVADAADALFGVPR